MKNLLNLGKALNKAEQKSIFGGARLKKNDPNCDITLCCGPGSDNQCPADVDFPHLGYTIAHECINGACDLQYIYH